MTIIGIGNRRPGQTGKRKYLERRYCMKSKLNTWIYISTVCYILWRIIFTLPVRYGAFAVMLSVLLLITEGFGFIEALVLLKRRTVTEPERPIIPPDQYPEVDVLIATYNEPEILLKKTIYGCLNMDYPDKSKVHIYVCDDGEREAVRELAEKMGVCYIGRKEHRHAKAGNYNYALQKIHSDFVVTFDADMIPMHHFLTGLIPYFFIPEYQKIEKDIWKKRVGSRIIPKIGFVQSPQSFYNADLFQYNLYSENKVPNEQNFFFQQVQLMRNHHNSVIYSGSNAIISRKALDDVGGFFTESITEDLATGLLIQSRGYRCYAVSDVYANGLAPIDLADLFKQRARWARGCIQTIRNIPIFRMKGLSRGQKLDYFLTVAYWYTSFRRIIFIIMPIFSAICGIPALDCSSLGLLFFWLPQMVLYNIGLAKMAKKTRTARLSNIYDTSLLPALLPAVFMETLGIQQKKFSVTNKDPNQRENKENQKAIRKSIFLFLFLLILSFWGMVSCFLGLRKTKEAGFFILLFWICLNSYYMIMSLLLVNGRKIHRSQERFPISISIMIKYDGQKIETITEDLSEGGVSFFLEFPYYIPSDKELSIQLFDREKRYKIATKGKLSYIFKAGKRWKYGMQFLELAEKEYGQLCGLLYDREPMLPVQISPDSGYYRDIQTNLKKRVKKRKERHTLLPEIIINQELQSREAGKVKVINFSYQTLTIARNSYKLIGKKGICLHIDWNSKAQEPIICHRIKQKNRMKWKPYLYTIDNKEELIYNQDFQKLLNEWMERN